MLSGNRKLSEKGHPFFIGLVAQMIVFPVQPVGFFSLLLQQIEQHKPEVVGLKRAVYNRAVLGLADFLQSDDVILFYTNDFSKVCKFLPLVLLLPGVTI
ncbi:hypothetical protein D3C86_1947910 [compost metagenome]